MFIKNKRVVYCFKCCIYEFWMVIDYSNDDCEYLEVFFEFSVI